MPARLPRRAWSAESSSSMIARSAGRRLASNRRSMPRGAASATPIPYTVSVGRATIPPSAGREPPRCSRTGRPGRRSASPRSREGSCVTGGVPPQRRRGRRRPRLRGGDDAAAARGSASTSCSISWAAPSSASGGATYRATARTGSGACGIAAPCPTVAIISTSLNWSPIARTFASGTRRAGRATRPRRPSRRPAAGTRGSAGG